MSMLLEQRAQDATHPMAKKCFELMVKKRSNVAVSADVATMAELLALAETVGPHIVILKTHIDIVEDFSREAIQQLQHIAQKHDFLIFEDRKFADIGHTVALQYGKGIYHIAEWADMVNAHITPGPGIVSGLKQVQTETPRGLLLLAHMSSKGALFDDTTVAACIEQAVAYPDFVMGFICQQRISSQNQWLYMTPGVQINAESDTLGQQYRTPHDAICKQNCDIIIVGRGIYQAADQKAAVKHYQSDGWKAYLEKTSGDSIVNNARNL